MERSETACCYCGVSYLIFHEFHQLQTRLAQFEAELQEQTERVQREEVPLGRLEWERALRLEEEKKQAEEKEKSTRQELKERSKDMERALKEELEQEKERKRRDLKKECQKIIEEKESQLRKELGDLKEEILREQREELKAAEEREKVLSEALQKTSKNSDVLKKCVQQLEER